MTPPPNATLDEAAQGLTADPFPEIRADRILALRRALVRGELAPDPERIARVLRERGIV